MAKKIHEDKRQFLLHNDNLYKNIMYLGWPAVIQSILQVLVGTIDIKMVGSVGIDAISAVGTGRNVIMIFMVLVMAVSTGTIAMVSRAIGRDDEESASISSAQSFLLCIYASAIIIPIGLLSNRWILELLGVSDNVLALAQEYMVVFFVSIPFFLLHFIAKSIFQAAGDTKTPLIVDIIVNITNVIGNFIFIYGFGPIPAMGVMGAAIGTALGRFVGTLISWTALFSGKFVIKVNYKDILKPRWNFSKQILGIGLPAAFQGLTRNVTRFILFGILARTVMAEAAMPAFVIGSNLNQYALMPGLAVGTAAATLSGMNIGANKLKRAEESGRASAILGAALMGVISFVFVIFAGPLINFFLDVPNPDVIKIGRIFLLIIAISEPFHAVTITLSRTMQGGGYTKKPFLVTLISWFIIRVPLAYLLALVFNFQSTGVWLSISITTIISGILTYLLFKRGQWKHVRIEEVGD